MKFLEKYINDLKSSNNGIALLFTLGILSLLLVLAVAFASTAIIEQKTAMNNADTGLARTFAQSSLSRIMTLMQYYDSPAFYSHCDSTTHPSAPVANHSNTDFIFNLETTAGTNSNPYTVFQWDPNFTDIHWEYISVDGNLLGRTAYVVIPGGGLDPGDLVKTGTCEDGYLEERVGAEINEINVRHLNASSITSGIATNLSYVADGGQFSGTWTDLASLFKNVGITSGSTKQKFQNWFVLNSASEPEAFWVDDVNNDGKVDINTSTPAENELYDRFNLARTDWDSLTLGSILAAPSDYDGVGATDGSGIKWLNDFGKDTNGVDDATYKGDFTNVAARRNQIAANLLDYCDHDTATASWHGFTEPTRLEELATTDWGGVYDTPPTYVGLDCTPYVNELVIYIPQVVVSFDDPGYSWGNLQFRCKIELINIYDKYVHKPADSDCVLRYDVSARVVVDGVDRDVKNNITGTLSLPLSATGGTEIDPRYYRKGNYSNYATVNFDNNSVGALGGGLSSSVHFTVNDLKIYIKYTGGLIDYANVDAGASVGEVTGIENFLYEINYQANDPRHNQFPNNWTVDHDATDGDAAETLNSPYKNSACNCNPGGNKDAEPGTLLSGNPMNTLSTAYIRNGPIESPWELGAIHRAAAWETLNLKTYNNTVNTKQGGTTYAAGDANILDQIKMTSQKKSEHKVSLKTHNDDIFKALFRKIRIGSDYGPTESDNTATPGSSGTQIDTWSNEIEDVAAAIKGNNLNYTSRACVAQESELTDGTAGVTQDTDAKQEELIGKFINLTSVSQSNYFTAIVLAQVIKDIGGATLNKDLNMDGAIESSAADSFDSDGDNSTADTVNEQNISTTSGSYDLCGDDILAEQKIMAEIYRDPNTKECKIIKMEYLDD